MPRERSPRCRGGCGLPPVYGANADRIRSPVSEKGNFTSETSERLTHSYREGFRKNP